MKIEGIPVHKKFMSPSQANFPAYAMTPIYITIHNTANPDQGADAKMHAGYLRNGAGDRQASWHFTVDDHQIYQSAKLNQSCWHAGDGDGDGNRKSIGIEICDHQGINQSKANQNAQALIRYLMGKKGISVSHVKPHQHWSGKYCPHTILPHWGVFVNGIKGGHVDYKPKTSATHTKKSNGSNYHKKKGAWKGQLLKRWDRGKPVKQLQKKLVKANYYPNKSAKNNGVDSYYGADTQDAVRRFQTMTNGLTVDGIAGKNTYKALTGKKKKKKKAKYPLPKGVLKVGSRGKKVKKLQKALNAVNFKVGKVDGIYGAKTKDAVARFQKVYDPYHVDGVYGKRTKKRLKKNLK